ncbi:uncharacterized protein METZ01_LOCUS175146, partial [marine metagenome]
VALESRRLSAGLAITAATRHCVRPAERSGPAGFAG